MGKFYEQSMLEFVGWISKKYAHGASVLLPVGNFALPDDGVFNISKGYNHTKDHCYQEGKGYWLDTQYRFFTADTEDKAKTDAPDPLDEIFKIFDSKNDPNK